MNPARLGMVTLLAAVLALGACQGKREEGGDAGGAAGNGAMGGQPTEQTAGQAAPAAGPDGTAGAAIPVEVMPIRPRDFTLVSTYLGNLEPEERVELKAEVEGVAEQVRFDEGSTLQKNDVMVNISTEQLQVKRDQAASDLALAESNLKRAESLADKKLIAPAELDQVRNRRETAFHALRSAEIELKKSIVRAPISGVVKTKSVSAGEYLAKGAPIGEILATRRLRARIAVPEADLRYFSKGKRVSLALDALPSERFLGRVRTLGIEADPASRSFPVEIDVDNAQGRMRPGMLARVTVQLSSFQKQVLIPRYAVLEGENMRFVFVEQDGQARRHRIETGAGVGDQVQVLSGLSAGDRLVVTNQQRLADNDPVAVTHEIAQPEDAYGELLP